MSTELVQIEAEVIFNDGSSCAFKFGVVGSSLRIRLQRAVARALTEARTHYKNKRVIGVRVDTVGRT